MATPIDDFSDEEIDLMSADDMLSELIDYMISLEMDDEAIELAFNALESGDYDRLYNIVRNHVIDEEVDELVSMYIDYTSAALAEDGDYYDGGFGEAVLNVAQRRQRALNMRRFKAKMKVAKARMARKAAPTDVITQRARRAAIRKMRVTVGGTKGKDYANLSPAEKAVIDARVAKRKAVIDKLAKRLTPQVRKADRDKFKHTAKESVTFKKTNGQGFEVTHDIDVFPEVEPGSVEDAPPLGGDETKEFGWLNKGKWNSYFTRNGEYDRRLSMFRMMRDDFQIANVLSTRDLVRVMEHAEFLGIDIDSIMSKRGLHEGADVEATNAFFTDLVKRINVAERLQAIAEGRDPVQISEQNGEVCAFISRDQMKQFEVAVDKLFASLKIDFTFTKHFGERMSDERNTPCLTLKELADFVKKIYKDSGKKLKDNKDAESVLKDLSTNINIPVAIEYDRNRDEFDVICKTIMRKNSFRTPNKILTYK